MSAEYKLHILTPGGTLRHIVTDMLQLAFTREVNAAGMLSFTLSPEHRAIADMVAGGEVIGDTRLEVYRRNVAMGLAWMREAIYLLRTCEWLVDENGLEHFTASGVGPVGFLQRALVAYPANTANRTRYTNTAAETIAKSLVTYNATTSGTTGDGRVRNADLRLTVQADGGNGQSLDFAGAWKNLLTAVQEVANASLSDFDVVESGGNWEFRWYDTQLGTDRRATVTFSLAHGNMARPRYRLGQVTPKTVAIAGGPGQEDARLLVVRTGRFYDAADNSGEMFVDARQYSTEAGLRAAGDAALEQATPAPELDFDVLQTVGTAYGVHYTLGDIVSAFYRDTAEVKQVVRVSVDFAMNGERIRIGMKTRHLSGRVVDALTVGESVGVLLQRFVGGDEIVVGESVGVTVV